MAKKVINICDAPLRRGSDTLCGMESSVAIEATVGTLKFRADLCDKHAEGVEEAFAKLGIHRTAARVDSKDRQVMTTATGKPFTAQDARDWLLGQGLIKNAAGRISKANLEKYAAAH